MAIIYETLHPRVATFLQRHFGLKTPVRTQVAPDIQPIIDTEANYRTHPELALHQGWKLWRGTFVVTGGAGQNAGVAIRMPVGTPAMCVLLGVIALKTAGSNVGTIAATSQTGVVLANGVAVQGPDPIDLRDHPPNSPGTVVFPSTQVFTSTNAGAAPGAPHPQIHGQPFTQTPYHTGPWAIIPPGWEIDFIDSTQAELLQLEVFGMERPLAAPNE